MANQASDDLRDSLRDWVLADTPTLTLALYDGTVYEDGSGDEVTGGSYVRQSVTFVSSGTPGGASSTASVTFVSMPATTVTAAALFDGSVCKFFGDLSLPVALSAGETLTFDAGMVRWQL